MDIHSMKHPTEKPSEHVMRFFTPEKFVRFNSSDEKQADRANEEWETALLQYRQHLNRIWPQIPKAGKKLAELCLHDAELLDPQQAVDPLLSPTSEPSDPEALWFGPAILPLKQGGELVTLIYVLSGAVRAHDSVHRWPFSKARPHWLFDEIDVGSEQCGPFVHRVLISDGRVFEIPFLSVKIHRTPLSPLAADRLIRTSA
jgi:hypothetical protein